MANTLVIVESPAKAKTITRYLGHGYTVRASMGHVRDLPSKRLGVEVEKGTFQPEYETISGRFKTISEIRSLAKDAGQVLLATDPDREGEAIAWHIVAAAGLGKGRQQVSRVEFHEITERAIKAAIANPRSLDMNLINAQQARRVLDRLVGYKLSPLLWKKVQKGTSAGRVQSVALRVVVERERAIEAFVPREFWTVEADLARSPFSGRKTDSFRATLWDAKENQKREFEKGDQAQNIVDELEGASWKVAKVAKKEVARHPSPPFITSTLQQEAARKLRLKTQDTMKIAQQLYEGISLGPEGTTGLITYMRTDSTQVAYEAQLAARDVIKDHFGPEYLPERPPRYRQVKGAQEAHEAIRPTKPARDPESIKQWLSPQQYQLYRLIWRRFIASQMAPARLEQTTVDIEATPKSGQQSAVSSQQSAKNPPPYLFRATGERVIFQGFMAVYREGRGDSEEEESEAGGLPVLTVNDLLDLLKLLAEQHFTEPPPRYGEASLVKALEELGVGRPSTYATILATLRDRGYVVEQKQGKERKFHPTELGRAVNDLLVARFPDLLDVKFTAKMETELDEVADGKRQWTPLVAAVYGPMMEHLKQAEKEVTKIEVPAETLTASEPEPARSYKRGTSRSGSGSSRTRRPKMYGESAPRTTSRTSATGSATRPRRTTRAATATKATTEANPTEQTSPTRRTAKPRQTEPTSTAVTDGPTCPTCNKPMVKRKGPYSEFWGCTGYPNCKGTRKI